LILLAILQAGLAGAFAGHTLKPSTTNHIGRHGWPRFYLALLPKPGPSNDDTAILPVKSTPSRANGTASPEAVPSKTLQYDVQARGYDTSGAIASILPS
jgi:hypothetical protein